MTFVLKHFHAYRDLVINIQLANDTVCVASGYVKTQTPPQVLQSILTFFHWQYTQQ